MAIARHVGIPQKDIDRYEKLSHDYTDPEDVEIRKYK